MTCEWVTTDDVSEEKCTAESIEQLMSTDSLKSIFAYRCNLKLQEIAMRIGQKIMNKEPAMKVWNDAQVFGVQNLALAYGDYVQVLLDSNFLKKIEARERKEFITLKPDTKKAFELLFQLSSLHKIERNMCDWLESGYFEKEHVEMIRDQIQVILLELKKYVIPLTDFVYPSDDMNDCMIAPSDGDLYKSIQN